MNVKLYNIIMSTTHVNAIRNESNYYASSGSRKNVPNGQAMMLLICRLGLREFEYEKSRIASEGNTMQLPAIENEKREASVPITANQHMVASSSSSSSHA